MNIQSLLQPDILLQVYGFTPGRTAAILPAVLGLLSVIVARWALARSKDRIGYWRQGAIVSLMMGLISMTLSGMHLARTAESGIGTGSGRLGAIVAFVLGLIGIVLGSVAVVRSRKNTPGSGNKKI
jgi:hypothetical protein